MAMNLKGGLARRLLKRNKQVKNFFDLNHFLPPFWIFDFLCH